ncbi:MAG: SIS domain-containing protein [Anaerolineales bacterium]|nr:SIS domain-containing protein [Anaerolineales bacterium]
MRTLQIYSDENKQEAREKHPYWVWESLNAIPDLLSICIEEEVRDKVQEICRKISARGIEKIFLIGRGSSYFLSLALQYVFNQHTTFATQCMVSSIFMEYPPNNLDVNSAVFIMSASGKSEGDLAVMDFANGRGAYTIAVTDVEDSPLTAVVDDVLLGPGGAKRELPATRSYATALFRMTLLAIELGNKPEKKAEIAEYSLSLKKLPQYARTLMNVYETQAPAVAEQVQDCRAFYVLAYGPNYANAEEFAMALNQSTGIPSMGYEMENFIHGPMQALTADEGVFLLAPDGVPQDRMLRLTHTINTIGAKTVLLGPKEAQDKAEADIFIEMPADFPEAITPVLYMIPLWQTAYSLGQLKNYIHPDRLSMTKPEFVEGLSRLMSQDKWVK